jgi:hypothetical protein
MPGSFQSLLKEYSDKSSWSFKTSFWKKIYPKNSKIAMTIFQTQGFLWFWDFLLEYPKTIKFRDFQGSLTWKKLFMAVFEFIGQFFFQNDIYKLQEVFSEHEIRVFLEKGLGSFQAFLILQI